jgi:tetratricopeptide (TPR) repeat protein
MSASRFGFSNWSGFFRVIVWLFMAFSLPGFLAGGWHGLVAAFALSFVMAPLIVLITSKIDALSRLNTGKNTESRSKELANELSLIRCDVILGNYDEALSHINQILRNNPDEPEVLYMKAQIVWRGFRNQDSAVTCLEKALAVADPQDQYYGWSQNLLVELCGSGREK